MSDLSVCSLELIFHGVRGQDLGLVLENFYPGHELIEFILRLQHFTAQRTVLKFEMCI